jgi:hypothetical protein
MLTKSANTLPPPPKQVPVSRLTVEQLVQRCIDEANGDHGRAVRLAGKYSRGARARTVVREIGNTLLRGGAR